MAIELKMPALSPTMEKGTLAKWLVAEGDTIKPGDPIAEVETDKAAMEFEAIDEGRVAKLVVAEGTADVAVGSVIAWLAEEGEDLPDPEMAEATANSLSFEAGAAKGSQETPNPQAVAEPDTSIPPVSATVAAGADPLSRTAPAASKKPSEGSVRATPLARRIAAAKGLSLEAITGSGPRGRIVKADLNLPPMVAPSAQPAAAAVSTQIVAPPPEGVPVETVTLSTMRKTIARRLTESKQQVPHFYLTARCNLDPLLKLRVELNASLEARGIKLSVNDLLIKAMALALTQVPDANVQYGGDELHRFNRADISMAVAIDGGLITPVIRDAGSLSLSAIAQAAKALANKAREGKLMPEDYQGGTATISNLGMFGIDEMFPVINPPQALILGIGAGVEQPWKVNGDIALATIMSATGSFDHRAIDGAAAAEFMAAIKEFVENPMKLIS
ncbi:MAG: pyruvate dehydrogenase complex dihydrolipoamide acetyltransferase [Novosphingobium sp.]|nr:pyruvate dehydrogenase complex dihydrolipoamide acetyltransferase [Novosphingobium sp.]